MSKPPLNSEEKVKIDPATGTRLRRTIHKRGRLEQVDLRYESLDAGLHALSSIDRVNKFECLRNRARDVLRAADLPTDDGEVSVVKQPARAAETTVQQITAGFRIKAWSKIVEEKSEPLSGERSAMLLIKSINRILGSDLDRETLEHIWSVVQSTHRFEMALGINEAATSGDQGTRNRAKGPVEKKAASNRNKEIITEVAKTHWKTHVRHRMNMEQTAIAIRDEVTMLLKEAKLRPVGHSTILRCVRKLRDSLKAGG
jgi:hypothetical protein